MIELQGFWSYVHDDDQAEKGRIMRLAEDIKAEYELQTGDNLLLFVDKNDLKWGEAWRTAIDSKLNSVAFFIPVITPRFFLSSECCRELREFASNAKSQGIPNLVLPILYAKGPEFDKKDNEDELIQLIKSLQWKDWTELRLKGIETEEYRRGVAEIVDFLSRTNRSVNQDIPDQLEEVDEQKDIIIDDSPGILDLLANNEDQLQGTPITLDKITENLNQITEIIKFATNELNESNIHGKGFSAKLIIMQRTAAKLSVPTDDLFTQSNKFALQFQEIDLGLRLIIEQSIRAIKEDQDTKNKFCDLFDKIRELNQNSINAQEQFQYLIQSAEPLIKLSRDMRPVVRKLQRACTIIIEASKISNDWVIMIDSSGIECD